MQTEAPNPLLQQPIRYMALSPEFKEMAHLHGFDTMDALLSFTLTFLLKRKGFTPRVHQELMTWLVHHDLIHLLKQQ